MITSVPQKELLPTAYGPTAPTPAPRWTRPAPWTGAGPTSGETGGRSSDRFGDGHTERWWAADATLGAWGPDGHTRPVVATTDPGTLPAKATWYLATNLPRRGGPHDPALGVDSPGDSPHPAADLAELVRIYGIRHWIEQSYKQIKDEFGWADFQVRSDTAIRRHQTLVNCAFSFCWDTWFTDQQHPVSLTRAAPATASERGYHPPRPADPSLPAHPINTNLAPHTVCRPILADTRDHPQSLVDGMVEGAPAHRTPEPSQHSLRRPRPTPLPPTLIQQTTASKDQSGSAPQLTAAPVSERDPPPGRTLTSGRRSAGGAARNCFRAGSPAGR